MVREIRFSSCRIFGGWKYPKKWVLSRRVRCFCIRRSLVTLYKECDSILLSCLLLSNQKCLTVKGNSADWACAMPRDQSVCRVGLPLRDEILSNCVNLKGTLGSLKQFKVSDEMSRNLFEIPTNVIRFTFVVWISLTVYASVPLHAVYASVPLREQTCHDLEE